MTDVRPQLVQWANWFVAHKGQIGYQEIRPFPLGAHLPMTNDCSASFTDVYYLAGAPDPNGPAFNYNGYGNTVTLAQNGQIVSQSQLLPGDAVIYYNGYSWTPGDTVHVAMVIDPGSNPLTMSHGWSGEPAFVDVSQDGRPHQFFRFATNSRFPTPPKPPVLPPAVGKPSAAQLAAAGLVALRSVAQATAAIAHGWHLWYFSKDHFVAQVGGKPNGVTLFANASWRKVK